MLTPDERTSLLEALEAGEITISSRYFKWRDKP